MSSDSPWRGTSTNSQAPSANSVSLSLGTASTPSNSQPKKTAFNFQGSSQSTKTFNKQTLTRRPHHLHDDESDDGGDAERPAFEAVTEFDTLTGKSISSDGVSSEKQPLTIPVTSKNNWRDRPGVSKHPKGKKNLLPKEVQALQEAQRKGEVPGNDIETTGPSMQYGLTFAQVSQDGDQPMTDAAPSLPLKDSDNEKREEKEQLKPLTEDEVALRALVQESKGEVERRSDLVIESRKVDSEEEVEDEEYGGDTRSFRADVASRPESATLDQYNAIPVEEFGAALLRGMGWKEGQVVGRGKYDSSDSSRATTPRVPARRPGFLGIGAKDVSGGKGAEVELGAWGKSAMRKGARKAGDEGKDGEKNTDGVYMPVMLRNSKTGETITEEELALRKRETKKAEDSDDWKERRDRNLEKSGRDRDRDYRRREYEGDNDGNGSRRTGSSRRDRSRSSGDRHSRPRKYEAGGSEFRSDRHYRERDRERDRDRRDRDRDRDRKSHRYYDDDRTGSGHSSSNGSSRHRDRQRDRDQDNERRRR